MKRATGNLAVKGISEIVTDRPRVVNDPDPVRAPVHGFPDSPHIWPQRKHHGRQGGKCRDVPLCQRTLLPFQNTTEYTAGRGLLPGPVFYKQFRDFFVAHLDGLAESGVAVLVLEID